MVLALLTRPRDDNASLAARLGAMGVDVLLAPMLDIQPLASDPLDLAGVTGMLVTSANALRCLPAAEAVRLARTGVPVHCVGEATAAQARALGLTVGIDAHGNAASLVRRIQAELASDAGRLVHLAGEDLAENFAGLTASGFTVGRHLTYRAAPAQALGSDVRAALMASRVDYALFYSPRTAATFVRLVGEAALSCGTVTALALSPAVAAPLRVTAWRRIAVAQTPNSASMLALLDALLAGHIEDDPR